MPIQHKAWISRRTVQKNPESLFLFGDNLARRGMGGQAFAMRGEPNTLGIVTKRRPSMDASAFFYDSDFEEIDTIWKKDFEIITEFLQEGKTIVIPASGFGTGRGQLKVHAPKLATRLQEYLNALLAIEEPST